MGDRATIEVIDEAGEKSPANIYLHWHGNPSRVIDFVTDAAPIMRKSDAPYAVARLVAHICEAVDKNSDALSVGLIDSDRQEEFDNGHFVVDMLNGTIYQNNKVIAANIDFYGG